MSAYVALLRAVNVGGTGKLPMSELAELCRAAKLDRVKTYIQSGNVVFTSRLAEPKVKATLEAALARHMGKPFGVLVRTADEMAAVAAKSPFDGAAPNRVIVFFLDEAPPEKEVTSVVAPGGEVLALRGREIFIHYPEGQGNSKLKIPFAKVGTGRNLNTVKKLAAMASELAG